MSQAALSGGGAIGLALVADAKKVMYGDAGILRKTWLGREGANWVVCKIVQSVQSNWLWLERPVRSAGVNRKLLSAN